MGLKAGLTTYLNARATLTALVSNRIGPPPITQGANDLPAVTVQVVSHPNVHSLSGASGLAYPRVQITAWSRDAEELESVRDAIVNALDGYAGAMGSVSVGCCLKQNERDLFDASTASPGVRAGRIFGKAIDFEIWHTEAAPTFA